MRAGQALAGIQLGAVMRLLVVEQLLKDGLFIRERVRHGRDGLIDEGKLLPAAGKFRMVQPCLFGKLPQEFCPVGDHDRADLRHAVVELRQRLQQGRGVVIVF